MAKYLYYLFKISLIFKIFIHTVMFNQLPKTIEKLMCKSYANTHSHMVYIWGLEEAALGKKNHVINKSTDFQLQQDFSLDMWL